MIENGDKSNSKPEVYRKGNVWQTGYAHPGLVIKRKTIIWTFVKKPEDSYE